ncbi:MAG: Spo0B domain-containing protein [Mycobacterium leprae]
METDALAILRRQRHSFLNHLQVISGWLQLAKPERASEYVARVAARMESDGQAIRSLTPDLGLVALELSLEAEALGVEVEWRISKPLPDLSPACFKAEVGRALENVGRMGDGDRLLVVSLGSDGLTAHSPAQRGER